MSKAHKYKNGRDIKAGDKVVGPDWMHRQISGEIVAGDKPHHKAFALKHGTHGNICPRLDISKFLHEEDAPTPPSPPRSGRGTEGEVSK